MMLNKLYQKSKLIFALAFIIIYVVGASLLDGLSLQLGTDKILTLPFLLLLSLLLIYWLVKNNLYKEYGLTKSNAKPKQFLFFIPLVAVASVNLWLGVSLSGSFLTGAIYFASMLLVGFLEELIFRGLLFNAMKENNLKSAIIVSSVTFGIGHLVNLINGSGADLLSNICQVISAVAFGFLFVIIFYKSKSLLPCIITHSVLNALSVFQNTAKVTHTFTIVSSLILTVIALLYTLYLNKSLSKTQNEE